MKQSLEISEERRKKRIPEREREREGGGRKKWCPVWERRIETTAKGNNLQESFFKRLSQRMSINVKMNFLGYPRKLGVPPDQYGGHMR